MLVLCIRTAPMGAKGYHRRHLGHRFIDKLARVLLYEHEQHVTTGQPCGEGSFGPEPLLFFGSRRLLRALHCPRSQAGRTKPLFRGCAMCDLAEKFYS